MQRKPFPVANSNIKMPDNITCPSEPVLDEDGDQQHRRQQLINFGHSQWGFNNWSWSLTKQDLDFVDFTNGKYCAGVAAYVSVTVKSFDIHRENVGYATSMAPSKGLAIHKSRKCAVTNALRETLLSFGGSVASDLLELVDVKSDVIVTDENNQNAPNKVEPKNIRNVRKEEPPVVRTHPTPPAIKNAVNPTPPVAKAAPMPASVPANRPGPRPPLPAPAPPPPRGSNVSFVLQPVVGGVVPPFYAPPRLAPPQPPVYPNTFYEYPAPWFYETYERPHGNVNLNFNIPPKNLVVNSRNGSVECKNACRPGQNPSEGEPLQYGPQPNQGCWIKPTIFYDGFWTEQKVKKWVAEQVEKQYPEDTFQKSTSPNNGQADTTSK